MSSIFDLLDPQVAMANANRSVRARNNAMAELNARTGMTVALQELVPETPEEIRLARIIRSGQTMAWPLFPH